MQRSARAIKGVNADGVGEGRSTVKLIPSWEEGVPIPFKGKRGALREQSEVGAEFPHRESIYPSRFDQMY